MTTKIILAVFIPTYSPSSIAKRHILAYGTADGSYPNSRPSSGDHGPEVLYGAAPLPPALSNSEQNFFISLYDQSSGVRPGGGAPSVGMA